MVNLHRRDGVTTDGGIFECIITESLGNDEMLYIGIYPQGEGNDLGYT